MEATISVREVPVWCILGMSPDQRQNEQLIKIDLYLTADITESSFSDTISTVPDSCVMARIVRQIPVDGKFNTIETLARSIAWKALATYPNATVATVKVRKNNIYAPTEINFTVKRDIYDKYQSRP